MTPIKLANGMSPELLKAELAELFLGAKVICVAAKSDFTSCGFDCRDVDIFDLHTNEDFRHEGDLSRPMGLKRLVLRFYDDDQFQSTSTHDPIVDATYTMKLFLEHCD